MNRTTGATTPGNYAGQIQLSPEIKVLGYTTDSSPDIRSTFCIRAVRGARTEGGLPQGTAATRGVFL